MRKLVVIVLVAAVGLTACTDQPAPPEPSPTATVTETVTADPAETLPSEDHLVETLAEVLEHPDPTELPQGAAALEELTSLLLAAIPEDEPQEQEADNECSTVFEIQPEVAGYGTVEAEESADEPAETTSLGALGFATPTDATALTEQVQDFVAACQTAGYELETLTHHTDEAFEIRVPHPDDATTSVVVVRNDNWVFISAMTPATDVGLALTLVDRLDEMLR